MCFGWLKICFMPHFNAVVCCLGHGFFATAPKVAPNRPEQSTPDWRHHCPKGGWGWLSAKPFAMAAANFIPGGLCRIGGQSPGLIFSKSSACLFPCLPPPHPPSVTQGLVQQSVISFHIRKLCQGSAWDNPGLPLSTGRGAFFGYVATRAGANGL